MLKKFVFKLLSIIGYLLYPLLLLYNNVKRYTDLLYPQIKKYSLSKPHPKILFLGSHIDFVGSKNIVIGERVKVSDYSLIVVEIVIYNLIIVLYVKKYLMTPYTLIII